MRNFEDLLNVYGVGAYATLLRENRIDLDIFHQITDDDLRELAIPVGDRKRILAAARSIAAAPSLLPLEARDGSNPVGKSDIRSEIRQVSALFADLVGSTTLSEELDIEDYHRTLAMFHACCAGIVRENGGVPARYIGDAQLGCFGYPTAAEDDASRAATAATQIVEAVPMLDTPAGKPIHARVGLVTGLAITGDLIEDGMASFGPASGAILHLAARLQDFAAPGSVVSDDRTQKLLSAPFRTTHLGERPVRGFAETQTLWLVDTRIPGAEKEVPPEPRPSRLIGREEELGLLGVRWSAADRRGSMVLITGEAGIGKSRLIGDFIDEARIETDQVVRMACSPSETLRPLYPFVRAIERLSGAASAVDAAERRARLESWLDRDLKMSPHTAAVLSRLMSGIDAGGPAGGRPAPERKETLFSTLVQVIERISLDTQRLFVLEDMHWIDPTTQEFLDHLVQRIAPLRSMLVCTYRPEHRPSFIGEPRVSLITLPRLDTDQAGQIMVDVMGNASLPPNLAEEILSRADGVPLFIEELTKSALEAETAPERSQHLVRSMLSLPTTLHGSLLARIDRVRNAHKIAPIGAAIGRTFSQDLLQEVADLPNATVDAILEDLEAAGLLLRHREGGGHRLRFKHALIQDAAYETMPRSRRREVHRLIGEALEKRSATGRPARPEILAQHFSAAELAEKACTYWQSAARQAEAASANKEVVAYIELALQENRRMGTPAQRGDREIEMREWLRIPLSRARMGSPETMTNLTRLRELREARDKDDDLFSVVHHLAGCHLINGRVSDARRIADEFLETYAADGLITRVLGLRIRGFCRFLAGESEAAAADFADLDTLCEGLAPGDLAKFYHADLRPIAACMEAWSLGVADRAVEAEGKIAEALRRAEGLDPWSRTYALCLLAAAYQTTGNVEGCLAVSHQAAQTAEERGYDYWSAWSAILHGWAATKAGRPSDGWMEVEEGIARYRATGALQMLPYANLLLAESLMEANRFNEARQILKALDDNREPPEIQYVDRLAPRVKRLCA
ncbi:MAG: AAA family ATPase [Pseudomonadota bacterium]